MVYKNIFSIGSILIAIPLILLLFTSRGADENKGIYKEEIAHHILCLNPEKKFGIVLDSFQVESDRIHWHQNLTEILSQYGFENYSPYEISREISKVFDVTKFKAGNPYHFYFSKKDSTKNVSYFVYEHTPKEYLKVSLGSSIRVEELNRESRMVRKECTGEIKTSLWHTMKDNDINPTLALELSEIYAWSINFFRLSEGDRFRVIYKEEFVDSTSLGISEICAAYFIHEGEKYYAIPFVQDSTRDFYDLEGNSLRREFLKAPLRFNRISSGYSHSRMHPILNYRRPHRGVDYAAPAGTPIHAIGDGTVIDKGYAKGAGYYLKIRHNSVYITGYNHLSGYAKGMREGIQVKQGETIGYVGSTGYSTGPHLDFRFWKNGHPVNPLKVEAPPVEPIKKSNLDSFRKVKENWLNTLG